MIQTKKNIPMSENKFMDSKAWYIKVFTCILAVSSMWTSPALAHTHPAYHNGDYLPCWSGPPPSPLPSLKLCPGAWMSALSDDVRLSAISIPGTHESLSRFWGPLIETQELTLSQQLTAGIRVFDLRLRHVNNGLFIYHGDYYQHASFDQVLTDMNEFLASNPSETILVRLSEHGITNGDNTVEWIDSWNYYEANFGSRFWNNGLVDGDPDAPSEKNPTLGEVRGKIVIMQALSKIPNHLGLAWSTSEEQDRWEVPNALGHLYNKWLYVKAHLEKSTNGNRNTFYINHLSGVGAFAYPYTVSSGHGLSGNGDPRLPTFEIDDCGHDPDDIICEDEEDEDDNPIDNSCWEPTTDLHFENTYPWWPRVDCAFDDSICTVASEGTNTLAYNWIKCRNEDNRAVFPGIVMADFPGPALIRAIIESNDSEPPIINLKTAVRPAQYIA